MILYNEFEPFSKLVNSELYNDFDIFSKLVENGNVSTNKILGSLEILAIKNEGLPTWFSTIENWKSVNNSWTCKFWGNTTILRNKAIQQLNN